MKKQEQPRGTRVTVKQAGNFYKAAQNAAVKQAQAVQKAINKSGAQGLKVFIPKKGANK